MRPPFSDLDIVAASDDEDMFPDPLDLLNTSTIQSSPMTADTSIDIPVNKHDTAQRNHELSQPPIAILPGAAESSGPSTSRSGSASRDRPLVTISTRQVDPQTPDTSIIGTFASNPAQAPPPAQPVTANGPPKPRPRPRPVYKPPPTGIAETSATGGPASSISSVGASTLPVTIVDPIVTSSVVSESSHKGKDKEQNTPHESIDDYSLDIAERAKIRSRGKSSKVIIPTDEIIELSDSDDELAMPAPSHSKTKTKKGKEKATATAKKSPKKKKKATHDPEPPESTLATLPIPTSDAAPSSQLPPSDPPIPSSANILLPTFRELSPPSSPVPAARKRKRLTNTVIDEVDDFGDGDQAGLPASSRDLMPPPAPANFFASSSPAMPLPTSNVAQADDVVVEPPPQPKKKGKKKATNDEDEDWAAGSPPKAKSKGKKKTAVADDGEESDWGEKPKPKAKPKARPKKKATESTDPTANPELPVEQPSKAKRARSKKMEVVVEVPSPEKRSRSSTSHAKDDEVSLVAQMVPAIPEPEESELSVLDSDLERGGRRSEDPQPTVLEMATASSGVKSSTNGKSKGKGKKRAILSDYEDEDESTKDSPPPPKKTKRKQDTSQDLADHRTPEDNLAKEPSPSPRDLSSKNNATGSKEPSSSPPLPQVSTPKPTSSVSRAISRNPTVIPKNTPMSELLRKVNSMPGSPFASSKPVHSPYLKQSKSMLRRIAPLHPNRRTPPPPPPRPPPPKKTKKQLELEEKWEMELEETVDGWYCLPEEERAALRRAKRDAEMGFND